MKNLKKFALVIFTMMISHSINAQEWITSIKSDNPTFFEIQEAFNNYWEGKTPEKGSGYKQFRRWEWFWQQRVGTSGTFPPSDILMTEWKKYNETHGDASNEKNALAANWSFYGPSSSTGGYRGLGRINCMAFHPTNANTMWVGTAAGGIWKTTNAGTSWSTNSDYLPVLGVSDIAISNSNPNTMYIATGDGEAALSLSSGYGDTKSVGVLKSTDGGNTWNTTGLNWSVTSQKLIRRLLINPSNNNILIAATSDGIYRTTDGGNTWNNQQSGWFMDLEFKPGDPNTVYGTTFTPQSTNAQIYASYNGGVSWNQITSFFDYNRINLAVSANWPDLVDALCSNAQGGLGGLWYSSNSAGSFNQYFFGTCSNNLLHNSFNASGCGGQGNYDLAYAINPSNDSEIWIGGVNTWRSTDAGNSFFLNNIWNVSQTNTVPEVHADKHLIAFHPLNNSLVYECNDGGLYVTNNGGTTWTDKSNGLGISQIYRIGATSSTPNNVICGLQDNGSKELYNGTWYEATGGDGMECIIDPSNSNIEYGSYSYGVIFKTTDAWNTQSTIVNSGGSGPDENGEWVTPFVMHPTNPNTLVMGKTQIYYTNNGGSSWSQMGNISGANSKFVAIAIAPSDPQTLYAATKHEFFVTTNGGGSWNLIATSTDAITYIAVSPTNPQQVWVTNSGYTSGEKVYTSNDGGNNWFNFSGSLPNIPVNCIVYQNGSNNGLYIGTDLGVYYRDNNMNDWIQYNNGLPNVIVNELEISYNNNKLWAATFGRGLWRSDLYNSVGVEENEVFNNFIISPNPTKDMINISGELKNAKEVKINLTNTIGQVVLSKEIKVDNNFVNEQLDLKFLNNGFYFLNIDSENSRHTYKVQKLD